MTSVILQFGSAESGGGISSLGLDLKAFIFQLIAFLIVLVILSKFVFPKLVKTLEDRRQTLEKSLEQAHQTELTLASAEEKATELLHKARSQADASLADAKLEAKNMVAGAEAAAQAQAKRILDEAQSVIKEEHDRLSDELKKELAGLVATATERIIGEKLDSTKDSELIGKTIKGLAK